MFGSLLCYEYAWNSYTRPKRSEFSRVVREYSKLVRESVITGGKTYIPHIGTFMLVEKECEQRKVLDGKAMRRYRELYPNRPPRLLYTETPSSKVMLRLYNRLPGFPWDVTIKLKASFRDEISKARDNNNCFIYKV